MTNEQLRKIDALVAEYVIGVPLKTVFEDTYIDGERRALIPSFASTLLNTPNYPHYSTDISAAWQVVEKLAEAGIYFEIRRRKTGYTAIPFIKREKKRYGQTPYACLDSNKGWVRNKSAPLAICLAALKAVGVEVDDD